MENVKIIAAYFHILEAAGIFSNSNEEISKTLFSLAEWTKKEYGILDEQLESFETIVKEIEEYQKTDSKKDE